MAVTVKTVKTKQDFKEFISLPWRIYEGDPNWVTEPLLELKEKFNPEKNPYYNHSEVELFIAEKDGRTEGRIVAHIDRNFLDVVKKEIGFFGFFECSQDYQVARALFDKASEWVSERGMNTLMGPFSFSTNDVVAFLVEGFSSPPMIMMPYNPRYYPEFAKKYGFSKAKDLLAYLLTEEDLDPRIIRVAEKIRKRKNFRVRSVNFRRFSQELEIIRGIYNRAWSENWGFIPMTEEEFEHIGGKLKQIADQDLILIGEVDDKPVAFSMALPNINYALKHLKSGKLFPFGILKLLWWTRKIKALRVLTLGVIPGYRKRGIELVLYAETIRRGLKKGYKKAEMSWILEDNHIMCKGIEDLGGKVYKRYRIYEKGL